MLRGSLFLSRWTCSSSSPTRRCSAEAPDECRAFVTAGTGVSAASHSVSASRLCLLELLLQSSGEAEGGRVGPILTRTGFPSALLGNTSVPRPRMSLTTSRRNLASYIRSVAIGHFNSSASAASGPAGGSRSSSVTMTSSSLSPSTTSPLRLPELRSLRPSIFDPSAVLQRGICRRCSLS